MMAYEEFALLHENAEEVGLPWRGAPHVKRRRVEVGGGRALSALVWGEGTPLLALLHGGAQNGHTWDTVALALDLPLVAIDLPGHGRSDWRDDHDYSPTAMTDDVAAAIATLAPEAAAVVGMSLGGLTALNVTNRHPDLVRRLVLVDVTPGTDHAKAEPIVAFISGPESFADFDEMLERTVAFNPTRSVASLRRGVLHNACEADDGKWTWRYDPTRNWSMATGPDFASLWGAVDRVDVPLLLVRGGLSGVVGEEDVAELRRRRPEARVVVVDGAGHSVQGDRPLQLAELLRAEVGA